MSIPPPAQRKEKCNSMHKKNVLSYFDAFGSEDKSPQTWNFTFSKASWFPKRRMGLAQPVLLSG